MERKISITVKSDDEIKKTIAFKFSPELYLKGELKSKSVYATMFEGEEELGAIEIEWENFNDFCLDLFNEHKKINENGNN